MSNNYYRLVMWFHLNLSSIISLFYQRDSLNRSKVEIRLTECSVQYSAVHYRRGLPVDHPVRDGLVLFVELLLGLG